MTRTEPGPASLPAVVAIPAGFRFRGDPRPIFYRVENRPCPRNQLR
jgi:hypothetical protein